MKILLVNIDSTKPNLALHKIERYHLDRGDQVIWHDDSMPILSIAADKIYVSCIFSKNRQLCQLWEGRTEIGGSGYDIEKQLPPEIEAVKPRINLGFTTRGCIRNCGFCVVPQKEGNIRIVGDLLDLWDGKSKEITLLDNNILAVPEHFKLICRQARENKIIIDFNQGLDHRLLTEDIVHELKTIRHTEYRFAFDHPSYISKVDEAITLLKRNGINRCIWYVLVGFNTTIAEDFMRLEFLKDRKQTAFVQRYSRERIYIPMARWANQHHVFKGYTWEQFLELPENRSYKPLFN